MPNSLPVCTIGTAVPAWLKHEEAVYYLVNLAAGRRTRILDFKDRCELSFNGKSSLLQGDPF